MSTTCHSGLVRGVAVSYPDRTLNRRTRTRTRGRTRTGRRGGRGRS